MNPFKRILRKTLFLGVFAVTLAPAYGQESEFVAKLEKLENEILFDLRRDDPLKIDEYGQINSNSEKNRLDNTFIQLNNRPDAQIYVVISGKTTSISNARQSRVLRYVRQRGQDPSRWVFVRGPAKPNPSTQLWLVPPGARPPG